VRPDLTQSALPSTAEAQAQAQEALRSVVVFPLLGGVATVMWLENVTAGVAAYYGLLALAVASPQGAALRAGFAAKPKTRGPGAAE
jgi:hypothetical protein